MMNKIKDLFGKGMTLSFEVFPPKEDQALEPVLNTLKKLYRFKPDFCSVTYGAGGSNRGRNLEICASIEEAGHTALAHLTCIGSGEAQLEETLAQYQAAGVNNILSLRGDLPEGWADTQSGFAYACDLLRWIKQSPYGGRFCVGVTCNPETHVESKNLTTDLMHLRMKCDLGADFCVTQLFYDNESFYDYRELMRKAGIRLPVVVGFMPVLSPKGVIRMTLKNGCAIPAGLARIFAKYQDKPDEFRKAGIEYSIEQIAALISNDIDGLHLYSLNRWESVSEILDAVGMRR